MQSIRLSRVIPAFLTDICSSDVWRGEAVFRKGENYLVAAGSGSGKSSLLAYITGERADYTGSIMIDDRQIERLNARDWNELRQKHISCVPQGLRLFAGLTVLENIAVKNRLTRFKSDSEIIRLLERAGLGDKRNEPARRLSFGQQQRVAIIRALCQPFDLLLADEPFSHLDDANIALMAEIIKEELRAREAGMLLCSLGAEYPFQYDRKLSLGNEK